jgi:hypothetical protein
MPCIWKVFLPENSCSQRIHLVEINVYSDERLLVVHPCLIKWQTCLIYATIIYVLSLKCYQNNDPLLLLLNWITLLRVTQEDKWWPQAVSFYAIVQHHTTCVSLFKRWEKVILFQLTFKPGQWNCRRTHVCTKARNVSCQFCSSFNIIANIMQFTCTPFSGYAIFDYCSHVMQDRYHHSVTHRVIAVEGRDVDIQTASANVLNKQSRTADKGWFSWMEIRRIAYNSLLWHKSM